jgi:hypothetical protein
MRKWLLVLSTFLFLGCMLIGCIAGPNPAVHIPTAAGSVAGFWLGLWQGLISPFVFVASLFSSGIRIYEVHNNGGWYDFGFLLGVCALFGGVARLTSR